MIQPENSECANLACVNKGVNNEEGINVLMVFIDVFFYRYVFNVFLFSVCCDLVILKMQCNYWWEMF